MKVACESCKGRGWKWVQGTGPSCIHADHKNVCDSCSDFLARLLPVIAASRDRKPMQEDIVRSLGYTTRHLRRLCANFGYHAWSEFYAATRDGLLHEQHDNAGNAVVLPFRRLA
jgi:hypothetical protein